MVASEARLGAGLLAVGGGPLGLGALLPLEGDGPALWCPFRAATGVPCPLCGGTRAVVHLAHGDPGVWSYNAPWALLLAAAVIAGAVALIAAAAGRTPLTTLWRRAGDATRTPARMVAAIALVATVPWAWALAHADTIAG